MSYFVGANIVPQERLREIHLATLGIISDAVSKSFGPYASNSIILNQNGGVKYTKDGYDILKGLNFGAKPIEHAVLEDMRNIAGRVVHKVGNGTTTAAIASHEIYKSLTEMQTDRTPFQLMEDFKTAVSVISKKIESHAQKFDDTIAYDIAMVATNGNTYVASLIQDLYKEHGNEVYITSSISNTEDTYVKSFDGLTVESGYIDSALINTTDGRVRVKGANIFVFDDPIDTPEMGALLDMIVKSNIYPYFEGKGGNPTVVFTPKLSRDMSAWVEKLMSAYLTIEPATNRPPLLIVQSMLDKERFSDIAVLSGAKPIKKYINLDQQKRDIELGLAPTPDTILSFAGKADMVEADTTRTTVIRPEKMLDDNGERSAVYTNLIAHCQAEYDRCLKDGSDIATKGAIKRRLQSLKANLIEVYVGGMSTSDREAVHALLEDTILDCRSAAENGFGYASSFELLRAISEIKCESSMNACDENCNAMINVIDGAFRKVVFALFALSGIKNVDNSYDRIIDEAIQLGKPFNVKTKEFSTDVVSSIQTDIAILEGICTLIGLMFTANQFIIQAGPEWNSYFQKLE